MNDEQQFWIAVWKIVGASVVSFVAVCAVSCQATNYHIRSAIESGAKPVEAKCALSSVDADSSACLIAFGRP